MSASNQDTGAEPSHAHDHSNDDDAAHSENTDSSSEYYEHIVDKTMVVSEENFKRPQEFKGDLTTRSEQNSWFIRNVLEHNDRRLRAKLDEDEILEKGWGGDLLCWFVQQLQQVCADINKTEEYNKAVTEAPTVFSKKYASQLMAHIKYRVEHYDYKMLEELYNQLPAAVGPGTDVSLLGKQGVKRRLGVQRLHQDDIGDAFEVPKVQESPPQKRVKRTKPASNEDVHTQTTPAEGHGAPPTIAGSNQHNFRHQAHPSGRPDPRYHSWYQPLPGGYNPGFPQNHGPFPSEPYVQHNYNQAYQHGPGPFGPGPYGQYGYAPGFQQNPGPFGPAPHAYPSMDPRHHTYSPYNPHGFHIPPWSHLGPVPHPAAGPQNFREDAQHPGTGPATRPSDTK